MKRAWARNRLAGGSSAVVLATLALAVAAGSCATMGDASDGATPVGPAVAAVGAGDGAPTATSATTSALAPAAAPTCAARAGADRLRRSALLRTIDAGLGAWLQTVSVDPMLDHGRFRGWIVRSLPSDDVCYRDVDLRENDVVTRVNGRSVEHPEDAHAVWVGLRTAPELVVDFVRAEKAHTLRFKIVDQ
jgi:hypothetical protein